MTMLSYKIVIDVCITLMSQGREIDKTTHLDIFGCLFAISRGEQMKHTQMYTRSSCVGVGESPMEVQ